MLGRRYRLLSQVGRGGMGRVWHAHDDLLHRDVAVKEVIFPPGLTASDREVLFERTLREARSTARLSHPGIVTVHDVVEEDDRPWIVMEFVHARSLQQVIDEDGRLPYAQVADIGAQMLAALRVAHAAGVLHRDVKPANVLLDTGTRGALRVVITDFGIARMEGDANLTQTGLVLGSPAYIAPERARGEPASPASDLWSLGATLYAACEGRGPHERVEAMAALAAVLHEEAEPPSHAGPLAPVLMGLLVKEPAERLTADQAAADLARTARGDAPSGADVSLHYSAENGSWTLKNTAGIGTGTGPAARELDGLARDSGGQAAGRAAQERRIAMIVAGVLLVAVVVGALLFVLHHPARSSPGRTTSGSPSPRPTTPPVLQRSKGPGAVSIAVPAGWSRQVISGSSVRWTQRSTGAQIQVDAIPWDVPDPVEHWQHFEREVVMKGTLPGYHELWLSDRFPARGWPAADLEYTWTTRIHGTLRAYDRGFTANGRQYALLVAAPIDRWSRYAPLVNAVFASFEPG